MTIKRDQMDSIASFLETVRFDRSALILDLDGTVLFEDKGKVFISGSVEKGIRSFAATGRPVVVNTLRFPISIIERIAPEWMGTVGKSMNVVLLNGSLLGKVMKEGDTLSFEETDSYPLSPNEVKDILSGIRQLLDNDIRDIVLFYYPRKWQRGEIIWTPEAERIEGLREKYRSASTVQSGNIENLAAELLSDEICMMLLLIDRPRDTLMAYQHQSPNSFFVRNGVSKAFGTLQMANYLCYDTLDCIAAGNAVMDNFLDHAGLSIIVGNEDVPHRGKKGTLRVEDPAELGDLLVHISEYIRLRTGKSNESHQ